MAETLTASGGSISDAVVEDFPSSQERPALRSECLNSVSTSKIPPYSTRIATMMQNRKNYSDQVEFNIASSKVHWSALEDEVESEDDENCVLDQEKHEALMKANKEAFENLKRHPHWGPFFSRDGAGGVYWLKVSGSLYSKVEVGKKVAEGGQAKIYECRGIHANGSPDDLMLKVFRRGSFIQDLQKEWPQTIFDPFIDENGKIIKQGILLDDGRFAFVMRKSWGDLRRLIDLRMQEKSLGPPFPFPEYLTLMHDVARQMRDLHKRDIFHKDLKADNILVDKTAYHQQSYGDSRIADYECSIGVLGTTFWRAPEILLATKDWLSARRNGNDPPPISFTKAADVYSYGMVLYEAWTGLLPFEREGFFDDPSDENYDRVIRGERPELPDDMDWELKDLITKCWHGDEEQRPTFAEIYAFLSRIDSRINSSWTDFT